MKLNIIKKYYYKKNKKLFKIINSNFILNNYIIIKLNIYEYINNNLQIFTFKGIIINKNNKNNYIIILKYNNYDILYLYFYLNSLNLINIFKIGKFNI
ncbi:hypothetical protein PKNA1_C2_API05400 [Plasmodium knowlesi strain H]|uniref:Uncharacterized protein n=3 Tax=Plasmodium knowlesi TaxID=5850 RepID=A0A679L8M8_PLAKH|nr:hypothetical protein I6V24_pgp03 [Plasmodium knowlesi strain H]BBB58097.1 hypothetical protein [Plasmodium knowlesi]CAA9991357.1 hypothetical protein PKNH_API05400 [Plasmodium knowlesi strain H]SBO27227.1 hypothetical protein PKNA1_C2_API05400 [Plasmodium knowlesi strain H]VVS80831.1 hypothetical protein PKNH_API05400 [Plasmodium knowlesi strain H]